MNENLHPCWSLGSIFDSFDNIAKYLEQLAFHQQVLSIYHLLHYANRFFEHPILLLTLYVAALIWKQVPVEDKGLEVAPLDLNCLQADGQSHESTEHKQHRQRYCRHLAIR